MCWTHAIENECEDPHKKLGVKVKKEPMKKKEKETKTCLQCALSVPSRKKMKGNEEKMEDGEDACVAVKVRGSLGEALARQCEQTNSKQRNNSVSLHSGPFVFKWIWKECRKFGSTARGSAQEPRKSTRA